MINLLPPLEKEKLLLERKRKLIIILWIFVLSFVFYFILILLPIKFYIQGQVEYQRIILQEVKKEFEQSGVQDLQEKIDSANLALTKLDNFYQNKIYLVEILEKISGALPQETYITDLSAILFETDEELELRVSLSGFAPTREILFNLKKNLEEEKDFKKVHFPPTNWVEPFDIDFLVNFEVDIR